MFVNDQNKLVVYHCSDTGYEFPSGTSVDPPTSSALSNDVWYNAIYVYDHSTETSNGGLGILYIDRSDNFVGYGLIPTPNASTASTEVHIGTRADENANGFANADINDKNDKNKVNHDNINANIQKKLLQQEQQYWEIVRTREAMGSGRLSDSNAKMVNSSLRLDSGESLHSAKWRTGWITDNG